MDINRICPCGECGVDPTTWECRKARDGFYVTVYVEGPATLDAADALVRDMLDVALPGAPGGTTASVVSG
jgi:hypothetical protein